MPRVATLAERPDMRTAFQEFDAQWPPFMEQDAAGWGFGALADILPHYQLLLLSDDGGTLLGHGHSGPIPWDGTDEGLPDQGWDHVIGRCLHAHLSPRPTPAVSAFEIVVDPGLRGTGLSTQLVRAMIDNSRRLGHTDLVAPVRPSAKDREPRTPMSEYAFRVRPDGLPVDPWLRVHVRLGGKIVKVCPAAMSIAGSLRQWRAWSGLPLADDGATIIPGALAPVHVSLAHDHGVYVEPNVWVRHRL